MTSAKVIVAALKNKILAEVRLVEEGVAHDLHTAEHAFETLAKNLAHHFDSVFHKDVAKVEADAKKDVTKI